MPEKRRRFDREFREGAVRIGGLHITGMSCAGCWCCTSCTHSSAAARVGVVQAVPGPENWAHRSHVGRILDK